MSTSPAMNGATYDENGRVIPPSRVLAECPEKYAGPRYPQGSLPYTYCTEALEVHWEECCTPAAPCELAAFQILATSGHGHLSPSVPYADEQPTPRSTTPGRSSRTIGGHLASDKQVDVINRIAGELITCDENTPQYGVASLAFDYLDGVAPGVVDGATVELTKKRASQLLDKLIPMSKELRAQRRLSEAKARANAPTEHLEVGALYRYQGEIYRVHQGQDSGRRYAKKLLIQHDDEGAKILKAVFAPGVVRHLTAEMRLTLAEAEQFGQEHGFCCVCSRTLTRQESIARGIGPICAEKF